MDLEARGMAEYELLDSGDGRRLERFGAHVFDRPSPVSLWRPAVPDRWASACARYERTSEGNGEWRFRRKVPATWMQKWPPLTLQMKPTGFGHVGVFPEHTAHWSWLEEAIGHARSPCRVLHLFAYTGSTTLFCARSGAEVCHVDAVRDINDWARKNAEASGLNDAPVRWITDDVVKFVAREVRRGRRYEGVILDPPSYGKGTGGERWVLDDHLPSLLDQLLELTAEQPRFILFTCHTVGFSPPVMQNLLRPWQARHGGHVESGTMVIRPTQGECVLPAGFYARWRR